MRERLYLETVETVLRDTTKIVMDGGSGNVTYLPLDKLLEQRSLQQRPASEMPPTVRLEDGTAVDAEDPRARRER